MVVAVGDGAGGGDGGEHILVMLWLKMKDEGGTFIHTINDDVDGVPGSPEHGCASRKDFLRSCHCPCRRPHPPSCPPSQYCCCHRRWWSSPRLVSSQRALSHCNLGETFLG